MAISPAQSCFAALCVPPVVVATTWSNVALCLAIRNRELEEVLNIDVPSGADSPKFSIPSLARALALISIHEQPYVFCATGDGRLLLFCLVRGVDGLLAVGESRAVSLGVLPVRIITSHPLDKFSTAVLCCSDRACLIRGNSSVFLLDCTVAHLAVFKTVHDWNRCIVGPLRGNNECTIISCHGQCAFCKINTERRLRITTVPLGKSP